MVQVIGGYLVVCDLRSLYWNVQDGWQLEKDKEVGGVDLLGRRRGIAPA